MLSGAYAESMNAITVPLTKQVVVLVAPLAARDAMLDLAAKLSLAGPLRVLDGGNLFNAYRVARAVRRQTALLEDALNGIRLSRAFTCYQMLALLAETPPGATPVLVLDLLCTFYDESVPLAETRRLLDLALSHLRRLAQHAPVVVSTRPPAQSGRERLALLDRLQEELPTHFLYPEALPEPVLQPALFPAD